MNALNITRENYEEYFILYIDDELSSEERSAVEEFAAKHTDLAKELLLFINAKLKPEENLAFAGKDELLRTEGITINETNYEEYFLLYVDNELSKARREETELFVLQHPQLQPAFTAIKKTVLMHEDVIYGNKTELLRYEKKKRFILRPLYIAAAAVFAGVCLTGWWFMQNKGAGNDIKISAIQKPAQHIYIAKPQTGIVKTDSNTIAVNCSGKHNLTSVESVKTNKPVITASKKVMVKQPAVVAADNKPEEQVVKQDEAAAQNEVTEHKTLQEDPQPFLINKDDKKIKQNDVAKDDDTENSNEDIATNEFEKNNIYKPYTVAYKEINTAQDDEKKSLYVGGFNLNKDKVKGLLKKAGKLFGNKARNNTNDRQQIQIANMDTDINNQ